MSKAPLAVRLHPGLKAALQRVAERSHRSVTAEIEAMIEERAKKLGVLPKTWKPSDSIS